MADKAFCKFMDDSFGRGITCRKGITRISIYSSKDKVLSFPEEFVQLVNLPPGHWQDTPGNGALSGAQC